ncbi:MAG: ABC transporter permease [Cytophagaceae bacterium]|nr:ABC transporter permease [Cytophagaceae bacterium]
MNKIWLIVQREFLTRVRKKSFLVMTMLGPFLFAAGMIVPIWVGSVSEENKVIEVLDNTGYFQYKLPQTPGLKFAYFNGTLDQRIRNFVMTDHEAILHIPATALDKPEGVMLYSESQVSPQMRFYLEKILSQQMSLEIIKRAGLDTVLLNSLNVNIAIQSKSITNEWQEKKDETASLIVSLFSSVLILFFIVLYGGQVMRGVIEEKSNRIIEVIISSVKPFQLMMGKIAGIALVSMLQFLLWISITLAISYFVNQRYGAVFTLFSDENIEYTLKNNPQLDMKEAMEINELVNAIESIDFTYILAVFIFYFIVGYLLYSAIFAAIGSVVDSETDTQQFVFALIAPLMFCMVMANSIISDPNSGLAYWLSIIPFTSPVTMMLRIPFGVPVSELFLSMGVLVFSFILFTYIASKIYRVGILMYGKKASLGEVLKWLKYK